MHPKMSPTMCQKQLLYLRDKCCRKPAYHQWFTTLIYSSFIIQFHLHKLQILLFSKEKTDVLLLLLLIVKSTKFVQLWCSHQLRPKRRGFFPPLYFNGTLNQWLFFSEELNHLKEDLVEFLAVGSVRKQFKFKDTFYNRLPWNRDRS